MDMENVNKNKFSREYLYRECVMHRHALGLVLIQPVIINDKEFNEITMLDVTGSKEEMEQYLKNVLNGINIYGKMSINISDMLPNGISSGRTINIDIDTENIFEICKTE